MRIVRPEHAPLLLTTPSARRSLFTAAIDGVLEREGRNAFRHCDALTFVVSGRHAKKRGTILWPHSNVLVHRGRTWRYYLMAAAASFRVRRNELWQIVFRRGECRAHVYETAR